MAALLEVDGLSVDYRARRGSVRALRDVSLSVAAGETVGLVGESGSGKSTIARAVLGLAPVAAGSVRFAGEDITHVPSRRRRALYGLMQIVFQDPYGSLNPARTIGQTLAEPLIAHGGRDRAAVAARVAEMLERVGLPRAAADRHPDQFSGGQRQRIAIARALVLSPRLVICDEPVSALDLSVQAQVINLLQELRAGSGLSLVFISHDLEVVRHLCDRVVVLYRGEVMEQGEAERLATAPAHPYTFALEESSPIADPRLQKRRLAAAAARRSEVATERKAPPADACPFAPRCAFAEPTCWTTRPELRPISGPAAVACHRYPEWRAEQGELLARTSSTTEGC